MNRCQLKFVFHDENFYVPFMASRFNIQQKPRMFQMTDDFAQKSRRVELIDDTVVGGQTDGHLFANNETLAGGHDCIDDVADRQNA